ncbi:MAG: type I DNA topoisomerase [Deltaproteobacteria bacterium]|nr:type I DNA topoisomerase [Deltaproteobacteria bacterium]
MATTLVIVESPAKARTIKKYLGAGYEVLASNGHVKDLPKKLGVDVEHDFLETYETIAGKAKVVAKLKSAAQKADHVLLATDPDREGEAIAFHIAQEIDGGGRGVDRVEFHEITRRGIEHGVRHPRRLDTNLYDAQRARRVLDRIVGYDVSALVWSKLAYGLSAGRVQSVALRLIVDRESEIDAFVPREYWSIGAALSHEGGRPLGAKLVSADGEKIDLGDAGVAGAVSADLERATFQVQKITRREQRRRPPAPYTTSKLQQDASSYLHLPARRTMRVAQSLYEGCDLKQAGGPVGLITYIRTDSTRVADEAVREVRAYIEKVFGAGSLPEQAWIYKSKKSAQDAHEAIRPTHVDLHPDAVRRYLTSDQYRLYKLVWTRFVASQMAAAVYDQTSIDIEARPGVAERRRERYLLRATGRILKSPGWLQVTGGQIQFAGEGENGHDEGREEQPDGLTSEPPSGPPSEPPVSIGSQLAQLRAAALCGRNETLPGLPDGALLDPVRPPGVVAEQKFTQPPPRYNEGSLVRELEKRGIGRPSTYAEIIGKVQARDYVRKLDGGAFQPSELGRLVVGGLVRSQLDFMDPGFTAEMEEELDEVGAGRLGRAELLRRFYHRFKEQLDRSKQQAAWKPAPEETSESCEECGAPMLKPRRPARRASCARSAASPW